MIRRAAPRTLAPEPRPAQQDPEPQNPRAQARSLTPPPQAPATLSRTRGPLDEPGKNRHRKARQHGNPKEEGPPSSRALQTPAARQDGKGTEKGPPAQPHTPRKTHQPSTRRARRKPLGQAPQALPVHGNQREEPRALSVDHREDSCSAVQVTTRVSAPTALSRAQGPPNETRTKPAPPQSKTAKANKRARPTSRTLKTPEARQDGKGTQEAHPDSHTLHKKGGDPGWDPLLLLVAFSAGRAARRSARRSRCRPAAGG